MELILGPIGPEFQGEADSGFEIVRILDFVWFMCFLHFLRIPSFRKWAWWASFELIFCAICTEKHVEAESGLRSRFWLESVFSAQKTFFCVGKRSSPRSETNIYLHVCFDPCSPDFSVKNPYIYLHVYFVYTFAPFQPQKASRILDFRSTEKY